MESTTIRLNSVGKRFNFEWILQHIDFTFTSGNSYAILGANGSGKSTLLQLIAGNITPSSGTIECSNVNGKIDAENFFHHISIAAPYLELVEEFTLREVIRLHRSFKNFLTGMNEDQIVSIIGLRKDAGKQLRNFSSGMKQRVKVALAVLSDVPVVLLDEPATNLDQAGVDWYIELIKNYARDRMIIVCSNTEREYSFCREKIDVMKYKN